MRWTETIVQNDSDEAEFDRMTDRITAGRIGGMCKRGAALRWPAMIHSWRVGEAAGVSARGE